MKFSQLFSVKSLKLVPPDVIFLRLKCIKFDFDWGSAPDPAGRAYSAPPDPLAGFKGPTSKGGRGVEGVGEGGKEGVEEEENERGLRERGKGGGRGKGGRGGRGVVPPVKIH